MAEPLYVEKGSVADAWFGLLFLAPMFYVTFGTAALFLLAALAAPNVGGLQRLLLLVGYFGFAGLATCAHWGMRYPEKVA